MAYFHAVNTGKGFITHAENEYQNKIVSRGQEYPILFNKLHLIPNLNYLKLYSIFLFK